MCVCACDCACPCVHVLSLIDTMVERERDKALTDGLSMRWVRVRGAEGRVRGREGWSGRQAHQRVGLQKAVLTKGSISRPGCMLFFCVQAGACRCPGPSGLRTCAYACRPARAGTVIHAVRVALLITVLQSCIYVQACECGFPDRGLHTYICMRPRMYVQACKHGQRCIANHLNATAHMHAGLRVQAMGTCPPRSACPSCTCLRTRAAGWPQGGGGGGTLTTAAAGRPSASRAAAPRGRRPDGLRGTGAEEVGARLPPCLCFEGWGLGVGGRVRRPSPLSATAAMIPCPYTGRHCCLAAWG